ncbi:hypothetical protein PsYK624_137280 [Phanerochaete sordida]|uniref:Uncharacterized protein n=1 Tax=Phanerochaete sordida TaxID=48140 RepID=A0A9P3GL58_9APHY|nr:hypothetical protein PsYK624_137280 [Phanerochaete sordida]
MVRSLLTTCGDIGTRMSKHGGGCVRAHASCTPSTFNLRCLFTRADVQVLLTFMHSFTRSRSRSAAPTSFQEPSSSALYPKYTASPWIPTSDSAIAALNVFPWIP